MQARTIRHEPDDRSDDRATHGAFVEDVRTDPLWEPFRSIAADKILGTIAIYYDGPREPRQADIDALPPYPFSMRRLT
jgi:hypothetical protein